LFAGFHDAFVSYRSEFSRILSPENYSQLYYPARNLFLQKAWTATGKLVSEHRRTRLRLDPDRAAAWKRFVVFMIRSDAGRMERGCAAGSTRLVPVFVILADGYRFGGVSKAAVSFFILNRETQSHPCGQIARDAPA